MLNSVECARETLARSERAGGRGQRKSFSSPYSASFFRGHCSFRTYPSALPLICSEMGQGNPPLRAADRYSLAEPDAGFEMTRRNRIFVDLRLPNVSPAWRLQTNFAPKFSKNRVRNARVSRRGRGRKAISKV